MTAILKRTLASLGITMLTAIGAHAADYLACATIKSAKDRLACFDKASSEDAQKGSNSKKHTELVRNEVDRFKRALTSRFKDPSSVQFKNVVAYGEANPLSITFVCGYLNAKNSYGGYVGFRQFVMTGADTVQIYDASNPLAIEEKWESSCTGAELYRQD